MSMVVHFVRHNGSTTVREHALDGPVPRAGEFVEVPAALRDEMEGHEYAVVTQVRYRIRAGQLTAHVEAVASHDSTEERRRTLEECGWLPENG
ncbi:hypothetical protein L599_001200000650 [Luteimonas sp. J16]|uniref:hypothetical protein n=1 Tax=unclassified Luteimonas TaxID=2629088 RepID=UPI0004AC804F|nr:MULTISPECIES: hypothetical protein [unclassified Luteimonas]TWG93605.1 hypothetical protein L599_001200000650 [Luteimonas sp. J16]